jgi:hypothetical protein
MPTFFAMQTKNLINACIFCNPKKNKRLQEKFSLGVQLFVILKHPFLLPKNSLFSPLALWDQTWNASALTNTEHATSEFPHLDCTKRSACERMQTALFSNVAEPLRQTMN